MSENEINATQEAPCIEDSGLTAKEPLNIAQQSNGNVNPNKVRFIDSYGEATGLANSFNKVYGTHREVFRMMGDATHKDNLGNNFKQFEEMQTQIYSIQFRDMLTNLFQYTNVPPTFNTSQLENMLRQFGGGVCVGLDDLGDLVILGRADGLGYNSYGNVIPSMFDSNNSFLNDKRVITNRNVNRAKKGDYVVFYNKESFLDFYSTDFAIIDHYSKLLATIRATGRMNVLQMRAPYFIKSNKNGVDSSLFESKLMSGELFFDIDPNSEFDNRIGKIDLNIPDRTSTLQQERRDTLNEMLTLFGIYNNPETKKERLVSNEASANNHIIEAMGDIYYNARRHAIELCNNAFGTKMEVHWNSTVATMFREMATLKR
ncbi:hypothetical protein [Enterococcus faecium]|uniref:hypothetical protein n=1 Tax=Enterococcus faecium TaxID=1352 RepID=UPI000BF1DD4B|nr:hypothetical protein [Enterococcus faecium]PEH49565.1 hypothetical protein CRM75_01255 [Enterococcus faecium]